MFTVAYLRERAIRFRDLARRAGNFEDAWYLLQLATDADRQAEAHDEQAAPGSAGGRPHSSPAGKCPAWLPRDHASVTLGLRNGP
jgi:hypothetical protein